MDLFTTFFMGGYECADHINRSGERINLLKETQHDIRFSIMKFWPGLVSKPFAKVFAGV